MIKFLKSSNNFKTHKFIFLFLFLLSLIALFFDVAFIKSTFICGKIVSESKERGITYFKYSFLKNEKKYSGSIAKDYLLKEATFDTLKKVNCVEIEYSFLSPSINRFADDRFKNK